MQRCAAVWALTVGLVAVGCGAAPTAPDPVPRPRPDGEPGEPPTSLLRIRSVLGFGDSITEGFVSPAPGILLAVEPGHSYPSRLQALLETQFGAGAVEVINGGRGGERVEEGRARFLGVFSSTNPDVVILLEGLNNINGALVADRLGGVPIDEGALVDQIVTDVRAMARTAQVRGASVLVATLTPVTDDYAAVYPAARPLIDTVNRRLRSMAAGINAVPVNLDTALGPGSIGRDGFHPTRTGYDQMARAFFREIVGRFATAMPAFDLARPAAPVQVVPAPPTAP